MNIKITDIISKMTPISLKEMDSVKLLNRTDTKYLFRSSRLPEILSEISSNYSILCINGNPFQDYKTIYFDTSDSFMYLAHQNGKENRYKIRHRTYLSTDSEFLEIKFKTNKGRTVKKRMNFSFNNDLCAANEFIQKHTPFKGEHLVPKSLVEYTRITLVDIIKGERATIDINLIVEDFNTHKKIDFTHVCIVELKRDGTNVSILQEVMKKHRIFQKSMSKYSIGTAAVNKDIKKNRFIKKLRYIEKLKQS